VFEMITKLVGMASALLVLTGTSASAQETPPQAAASPAGLFSPSSIERHVRQSNRASDQVPLTPASSANSTRRKDSVVDGGLIGAVIGGVGGSFLIVAASGGSDDVPKAMANVAALPALAGFAIGAVVDALR
jgi:hypothetical protein